MFVHTGDGESFTAGNTTEILLQDDFSFSQGSSSTDITLSEAGPKPARGSARFNESLDPVDWNFSTYIRPYYDSVASLVQIPDLPLWHALSSGNPYASPGVSKMGVNQLDTQITVGFQDNQHHELVKFTLYYLVDKLWYKVEEAQVGQAEISIDIEGIAQVAWSGQGTEIVPLTTQPFDPETDGIKFPVSVFTSAPYIKNKLTGLRVTDNSDGKDYIIPVTGGSVTINNNITYLTPSTLSRLDTPIGSFTGSFEVSGSLTAYLRTSDNDDAASDLLAKMLADRSIKNSFTIAIVMGGEYGTTAAPAAVLVLPTAHLSVPSVETEDVLSTSIDFKAIPTELDVSDELFIGLSDQYTSALIDGLITTAKTTAAQS